VTCSARKALIPPAIAFVFVDRLGARYWIGDVWGVPPAPALDERFATNAIAGVPQTGA